MKKLTKLLALVLAVAMLLPVNALAAENEDGPELVFDWLNWDEGHFVDEEALTADDGNHSIGTNPYEGPALIFYVLEDGKKTPVIPKGDGNVTVDPLEPEAIAPNAKLSEYYIRLSMKEYKDGVVTAEYNGATLSLPVKAELSDIGMYSAPTASFENAVSVISYSIVYGEKNPSVYVIATCTDTEDGRHAVGMALAEDNEDSAAFTLEKVRDDVYKLTLTGSLDKQDYHPTVLVTWQNVQFLGGRTQTDRWDAYACEWASTLVSESPTMKYDYSYNEGEKPTAYYDVKDEFTNELTLKAGESKTVYTALTYHPGDPDMWIAGPCGTANCSASNSALKLTADDEDPTKLTISSDVPGTYTFTVDNSHWWGYVTRIVRPNGTAYTDAELEKWDYDTPYYIEDDQINFFKDNTTVGWNTISAEEAFPGYTFEFVSRYEKDVWAPVTVTVTGEAAKPATETTTNFPDVKAAAWYAPAVAFASTNGYMNGNADGTFNPDGQVKGSEFAQILHNKEGKPAAADGASFNGVTDQWYAPAILWAAGKGIITDTGDTAVAPTANLTRQQIALMLYNYMGKPAADADLSKFSDADKISSWALDAVKWAVSEGILKGNADGTFNPTGTAKRSETAQILMNFFG